MLTQARSPRQSDITHPEVSSLASEYFSHALARDLDGNEIGSMFTLWNHFIQYLVEHDPPNFDWKKMDTYVAKISRSKSIGDFASPALLSAIAPYLVRCAFLSSECARNRKKNVNDMIFSSSRQSAQISSILLRFFSIPTLKFDRKASFYVEFDYPRRHGWNPYHAALYAVPFSKSLSERKM